MKNVENVTKNAVRILLTKYMKCGLGSIVQCFSTARPQPSTGPWHQLYRATKDSPGICHFSVLRIFHEQIFCSGNILMRIIFVNLLKSSDPDVGLRKLQYTTRLH